MDSKLCTSLYEITIAQFSTRIRQRDGVLLFYLGASGAVAGLAFSKDPAEAGILLLVPVLAGACGLIMAYHSLFVEALVQYCTEKLAPGIGAGSCIFEKSAPFAALGMSAVKLRTSANLLLLVVPTGAAIHFIRHDIEIGVVPLWLVVSLAVFALIGAAALIWADCLHIVRVHRRRREHGAAS